MWPPGCAPIPISSAILDHWAVNFAQTDWLRSWREIIALGPGPCADFMESGVQRATQLRQSSPFSCMLTEDEKALAADWANWEFIELDYAQTRS